MIQSLMSRAVEAFGPLAPIYLVLACAAALLMLSAPVFLRKQKDPLERLRAAGRGEAKSGPALRAATGSKSLDRFASFLEPQKDEEMSAMRLKLARAGYRGKNAVRNFHAIQFALGLVLLAVGCAYVVSIKSSGQELDMKWTVIYAMGPGIVGYYGAKMWLNKRVAARTAEMQNGFPDALDMMLVCVEAGQSLDQAIIRVSKELAAGYPALAQEFEIVSHEVKAGKDKQAVLRAFGERTDVPDIVSFVTVMIQSQTFGTSIADALRVYAAEMRDKRVMRAEEAANKLPTKITLGTMMFTVPPLLVVLVAPSVYDMMGMFASASAGP